MLFGLLRADQEFWFGRLSGAILEAAELTSFFLEGPAFGPGEEKDAFGRGD